MSRNSALDTTLHTPGSNDRVRPWDGVVEICLLMHALAPILIILISEFE